MAFRMSKAPQRPTDGRKHRGPAAFVAGLVAVVLGAGLGLVTGSPAVAATNPLNNFLRYDQTFFLYADAGELPSYTFTNAAGVTNPVEITITDPEGDVQQTCTIAAGAAVGTTCSSSTAGLTPSIAGVWAIHFDPTTTPGLRFNWDIQVMDGATSIPGRIWVELYTLAQPTAGTGSNTTFPLWIATREGYAYRADFVGFAGIDSTISSNGFGLVQPGTCTPTYQSVALAQANAGAGCGDQFKLFLEAPAADLPTSAPSVRGTEWVRPAVVPASATNLALVQDGPFSRAGELTFDLAGVNGGYTIQLDTNANGVYTDAVDRTIPWGSPPGAVEVPFDGLDGQGNALSVCSPMNARVVVDRVGEAHLTLNDVERLSNSTGNGLRINGATPGIVAANPLLYWDDRALTGGGAPLPYADGRGGLDTSTVGAHGWVSWGDNRAIENWTYYQAQAGAQTAIPSACDAALTLEKDGELNDANGNGFADLGETIDYTFTVANVGNAPVAAVTIDDPRVSGITPASADVPVFGQRDFTAAPYTVTQEDIDAGGVPNVASAAGTDPLGGDVISNDASDFVATIERAPALTLDKVATLNDTNGNGLADLGEIIDYTFVVENTGNVTITDVAITDARVTGISAPVDLAPAATHTFTAAPYVVTQADLNTGVVHNTATAAGDTTVGAVQSNVDTTDVLTPDPDPELSLVKSGTITADANSNGLADAGDTITYSFVASNVGTVDLVDVSIVDPKVTGITPATADIGANDDATFQATYVVTQADVDAGTVTNTATAEGTYIDPASNPIDVVSGPSTVEIDTPVQAPGLEVVKSGVLADNNGNGVADAGETITYTFVVENTGNVTLLDVNVVDDRVTGITPATVSLAPGDDASFFADPYVVTQADVDDGEVLNTAFARGRVPNAQEVFAPVVEHIEPVAAVAGSLSIDKSATLLDDNGNGTADAGEGIIYTFDVTNTGNVTLSGVAVTDAMLDGLLPDPIDFLPTTATHRFVADEYTVTAEDVAAGVITNVASASGTTPGGDLVESGEDTATIRATPPVIIAPPGDEPPVTPPNGGGSSQLPATGTKVPVWLIGSALLSILVGALIARRRRSNTE